MAEQNEMAVDRLQAEVQLARAIDVLPTAFALFDGEDRLVISNREYERIYTTPVLPVVPGARFEDLLRAFAGYRDVKPVGESREDWMTRRLGRRQAPAQRDQYEYGPGRWLEENDYVTGDQSVITVAIEITERKRANDALRLRDERLKRLQAELLQSTKLTAMAELSSALAHELNQPMTAMISYLTTISRHLRKSEDADPSKTCDLIEKAVNQAHRASKIISGQRELVKTGRTARCDEHLNKAIEEAITLAMDIPEGAGVSLHLDLAQNLPAVSINRVQIQQVILNLLRNALEAMSEWPRRELNIETRILGETQVGVIISDSGPGLPEPVRQRLFKPFVTTKREGMGIGLSICRSIIEAHGGAIRAAPNPAGGAAFHITLPVPTVRGMADGG
jgi:C4-dicarboxylate-specific signal transduction histidine kinase